MSTPVTREPLREPPRLGRAAAAAELEQRAPVSRRETSSSSHSRARVADDPLAPLGEGLADGVVAVGDELGAGVVTSRC